MRSRAKFAFEELEVDKVYQQQQAADSGNEFDELYNEVKSDQEAKKDQPKNNDQESLVEETGDSELDSEENTDDQEEPDADVALESFLNHHNEAIAQHFAQEAIFTEENLLTAGKAIGNASVDGLVWLKNIGFEYGPVLLKHVYKGVLFAIDKTIRAIFKGSVAITKYIRKRMNSYSVLKEKIKKAKETLNLIEESENEEVAFFNNQTVIQQLLISDQIDFNKNVEVSLQFFKDYINSFESKVNDHLAGIGRLIDNVIKTNGNFAGQYSPSNVIPNNFKKASLQGYQPQHEEINSYIYKNLLPGNTCMIGFFPEKSLTARDSIATALGESKIFLGIDVEAVKNIESVPFKSKSDLMDFLTTLDRLCNTALASEKIYFQVAQRRNGLKGYLNKYVKFLFNLKEKMSVHESMADIISLELQYLDKTYVAGSLQIHDYVVGVLNASLTYVKENIKNLS